MIKLEVGKRYVRRDGKISGVIYVNAHYHTSQYPFYDGQRTYAENGIWDNTDDCESCHDLITEYQEPKPIKQILHIPNQYYEKICALCEDGSVYVIEINGEMVWQKLPDIEMD